MTSGFSIVPFLVAPHDINNAIGFMAVGKSSTAPHLNRLNPYPPNTDFTPTRTAQVIGGNIFLSMAGCMYQNYGQSKLRPLLSTYSAEDVSMVIAGTSSPLFQSLSPDLKGAVIEQINTVMSYLWAVMIAGAAVSVMLAPFLSVSCIHVAWFMGAPMLTRVMCRGRRFTPPPAWLRLHDQVAIAWDKVLVGQHKER